MLPLKPLTAFSTILMLAACGGAGTTGSSMTTDVSDVLTSGTIDFSQGPAAATDPGANDIDFATILNGLRNDRSLDGFTYDARLDAAAQKHAEDMVNNDYFAHEGLNGSDVYDRITAEGYDPRGWAENLAQGQQSQGEALQAWIDSPSHNAALNADLEEFALGVAGSGPQPDMGSCPRDRALA